MDKSKNYIPITSSAYHYQLIRMATDWIPVEDINEFLNFMEKALRI